jgi:hypothetical protein
LNEALMKELYDEGLNDAEIAKRADTDKDRVRRWRQSEKLPSNYLRSGEQVEREYVASIQKDDWPLPVRPIQVNIPDPTYEKRRDDNFFVQVSLSDSHFPFSDPAYERVVLQIIADICPDLVVHHGDLLDCYSISRFQKDPKHRVSLQDEITMGATYLGQIANVSPFARRVLIGGNHEARLQKIIYDMANELPAREVLTLTSVWEQLTWPKLLGLDSMGWEWVDGKEKLFNKLIVKHGSVVRKKSAYTASGEYEKYGMSGMSGHTHRAGTFYHTDHNGPHLWVELGCGCHLNPDYCEDPDWQQSLAVVTWSEDRTRYSVEQIIVHDGVAIFRGKSYGV